MNKKDFYQTHLTEGQWSYINKVFFGNDCRKRKYSLRSLFEAVLFVLVSGCQWRMLPHDLPKWQTVSIDTSANGEMRGICNIVLRSLS